MKRFLAFIVNEALAGRAHQLCEYNIALLVFERDELFEPGGDPIVRNDARRLRQKLLEYYHQSEHADEVIIEVPKGSYVPAFRFRRPEPRLEPMTSESGQYRLTITLSRTADDETLLVREYQFGECIVGLSLTPMRQSN